MNILILQGPNLNLLGLKSSKKNDRLTLDKLNKAIKKFSRTKNIDLKILQTHKEFQAVNFLQRNRNWANGILFVPTSWARNNHTLLEVIKLIEIKTSTIYFDNEYSFGTNMEQSMMVANNIKDFTGPPIEACIEAVEYLVS
jgi:3-dehydroquinate dehydratase-2|tara:strand:+ start:603 stop:1025 length:423 start_codon:yes stop_codon:yes gene_type:complete